MMEAPLLFTRHNNTQPQLYSLKMRISLILRELSKTIRIFVMFYRIDNLI